MAIAWNDWVQCIEHSSKTELAEETQKLELDQAIPFVEKKLKLGYLYFKQDLIGTATNVFQEVKDKITQEKHNSAFVQENEQGFKILYMGWDIIDDGCGGFEIVPSGCGVDCCGPVCGCIGIAAVMAICGIEAQDVCSYDASTGESGGCIGKAGVSCCNCCDSCYTGKPGRYT